jgi:gluconolactonase
MISIHILLVAAAAVASNAASVNEAPIQTLAEMEYNFAHEAPMYDPTTHSVFFASNRLEEEARQYIQLNRIFLHNNTVELDLLRDAVPMINGATQTSKNGVFLVAAQGNYTTNAGIYEFNANNMQMTPLLTSAPGGKSFNSLNDIAIDEKNGFLWMTDPAYGFAQGFRPTPAFPSALWRAKIRHSCPHFEISEPEIVDQTLGKPNGVVLSADGTKLYVTDSGWATGNASDPIDPNVSKAVYVYDVDNKTGMPYNRQVFAEVDAGVPDGVKIDGKGLLYIGCGDGVRVFDPSTRQLVHTIKTDSGIANLIFVPIKDVNDRKLKQQLVMLNEKKILLVNIE